MKFTAALALGLAPVALAKAVHNVYPVRRSSTQDRRDGHKNKQVIGGVTNGAGQPGQAVVIPGQGQTIAAPGVGGGQGNTIIAQPGSQVIVVWNNPGGGAATTTVNPVPAMTQTAGAPGAVQTHQVQVGGSAGLAFAPTEVKANVGDMVIFTFMNANHTVTQSPFDTPCQAMPGGLDTGFQPNPNNTIVPAPQVAMQVMAATPLWFYCRQGPHCGKGMVMSINPTAEKTQAMFQAMAIAQNGTGTGGAITGNPAQGGAAQNPAQPAAGSSSSSAVAGEQTSSATDVAAAPSATDSTSSILEGASSTLATLPTETAVAGGAQSGSQNGIIGGVGTIAQDGQCQCSCACLDTGFPGGTGLGAITGTGQGGAIPAAMLGMAARR